TWSGRVWSEGTAMPVPPALVTRSAVSSMGSGRARSERALRGVRPLTYTVAPAAPSSTAMPRPAPLVAPATRAIRPVNGDVMQAVVVMAFSSAKSHYNKRLFVYYGPLINGRSFTKQAWVWCVELDLCRGADPPYSCVARLRSGRRGEPTASVRLVVRPGSGSGRHRPPLPHTSVFDSSSCGPPLARPGRVGQVWSQQEGQLTPYVLGSPAYTEHPPGDEGSVVRGVQRTGELVEIIRHHFPGCDARLENLRDRALDSHRVGMADRLEFGIREIEQ